MVVYLVVLAVYCQKGCEFCVCDRMPVRMFVYFVVVTKVSKGLCSLLLWPYEGLKDCVCCGCDRMTVQMFVYVVVVAV